MSSQPSVFSRLILIFLTDLITVWTHFLTRFLLPDQQL